MNNLARDIRYGLRGLSRSPGFAAAAILSLALAIGLNTLTFSVLNAVLFRPLDVPGAERLVRIGRTQRGDGFFVVSHAEYREVAALPAFSGVLAHQINSALMNLGEEPFAVGMEIVSGNYFDVLDLAPARGRGFVPEEDATAGTHPVLVISWDLWQERFEADPSTVGRSVRLNGHPFDIVGISPEGFAGSFPGFMADVWVPVMMQAQALPRSGSLDNRGDRFLNLIGRLAPDATERQATAQLDALAGRLAASFPETDDERGFAIGSAVGVHPMIAAVAGPFVGLLMAVVALVLLIAVANVANLVLARAALRRHETGLRIALGAGRARLIREHVVEGLLVTVPGAIGGILAAIWSRDLMTIVRPPTGLPVGLGLDVPIDARVLAFSVAVALTLGAALGLIAAAGAGSPAGPLAAARSMAIGGRGPGRLRNSLVVSQVAVSTLLLAGAGLLARTLINSGDLDAGVDADGVVVVSADPSVLGYDAAQTDRLWADMTAGAAALPQVGDVTLGLFVPLGSRADQLAVAPADAADPRADRDVVNYNVVAPGYFDFLGISVVRGREFDPRGDLGRPRVAIVNRTLAERLGPENTRIGRRLTVIGGDDRAAAAEGGEHTFEIVGVVEDIKYRRLGEPPTPFLYLPHAQWDRGDLILHVRSRAAASDLVAPLAARLRSIDPELSFDIHTLREEMEYSLTVPRIVGLVLALSAAVGLFLAAMGVFAVVSYATARRIPEIGVRISLGADSGRVRRLVVFQGLKPTLWGVLIGLVGAALMGRLLGALLYGVRATDPVTFGVVTALLIAVALVASYAPARRATTVDPLVALRSE